MWIGRDSKAFLEADKTIAVMKSVYVDDENVEKACYDGLHNIPGFMNRSYFCDRCCHCCRNYEGRKRKRNSYWR